jgi:acyl-homoserine lactone acylase PvdQ
MARARRGAVAVVSLVVVAGLAACSASTPSSAPAMHDRDVLPPGEDGSIPPSPHSTDQIPLYDGLTPLGSHVTDTAITRYFKDDPLGDASGTPEPVARSGLRIVRDAYHVPHIFGATRADAEFGAGWVAAEDRGLVLEVIRGAGRIAALDVPGIDAFAAANNLQAFDASPQTERFLTGQLAVADQFGAAGRRVRADAESYVAGINAYYRATHNTAAPWTVNDVVGASALIGAVFGRGGGNQVKDSLVLADLQQRLGATAGSQVFNDLREAHDPETPTTLTQRFPYESPPPGPTPGSAVVDPGSVQSMSALTARQHMSNALVVGPGRSASGTTVAVMGPQVGYYYPEILLEMDIHGGGLDARGASFPGTSLYVELGRGPHFAWSATSSGSENVDQFLDKLCNPDGTPATRHSDHYLFNGRCVAMTTFDAGYLHPGGGAPGGEVVFNQTVHGPVSGTCTVGGVPYAISTKRSTYGRDVVSGIAFADLNDGTVHDPQTFMSSMSKVEFTFNWFYADAHHVAYFSSGRLPERAPGTNPTLPTFGTGGFEWRGFLPPSAHPHAADPAGATLINWNNQPAPGWGAASDNWGEGPIDHVLLLRRGITEHPADATDLAGAMNQAATQDPRGLLVWPVVARVLAGAPGPDPTTQTAADLVTRWAGAGASLLDTTGAGSVDMPGAAILDQAWPGIVSAVLSPVLGPVAAEIPGDGGMSYVDKDLRTILGDRVTGRFSRTYCGNGDLSACRASLWSALQTAVDTLAFHQGPDPSAWRTPDQRITFQPGLLPNTMAYSNRPTFQQVVWFGRSGPG